MVQRATNKRRPLRRTNGVEADETERKKKGKQKKPECESDVFYFAEGQEFRGIYEKDIRYTPDFAADEKTIDKGKGENAFRVAGWFSSVLRPTTITQDRV